MTIDFKRVAAAVLTGALLVPAAADAKPGNGKGNGNGNGNAKHETPAPAEAVAPAAVVEAPQPAPAPAPAPAKVKVKKAKAIAPAATTDAADGTEDAAPAPAKATRKAAKATTRAARKAAKPKTFVFRGTVAAIDAEAGTVDVTVTSGNSRGRRFRGETVTFDLAAAKLAGVETDGVLGISLDDVLVGDRVMVQARLPRATAFDGTTIDARKLVDQAEREPVLVEEPAPVDPTDPVDVDPVDPVDPVVTDPAPEDVPA